MNNKIMDSLTDEQRMGIAKIILNADIEGNYNWNGEESVWEEDVAETLKTLARYFETYDKESALEQ